MKLSYPLVLPLIVTLSISACTTPSKHRQLPVVDGSLTGSVVRTDGHSAIRLTGGGEAICQSPTAAELEASLEITNAARLKAGLSSLRLNPMAQKAAEGHACDMARLGLMSHQGSKTSGPAARIKAAGYRPTLTAENIAAGRFDLVQSTQEWVASPGHYANIVIPSVRDYGAAYAVGADGKTYYFAAVYGAPRKTTGCGFR